MSNGLIDAASSSSSQKADGPLVPTPQESAPAPGLIGIVGLGRMGAAFAETLMSAGCEVILYDRNPSKLVPFQLEGAAAAVGLTDLASCRAVISALTDDAALRSVALAPQGLVKVLRPGAVHISMSTVSPTLSRELAAIHHGQDQGFVAAPVLGNPDLARAQRLFVLAAGRASCIARARPVLELLGQKVFVLGDDAGAASLMKLAANVMTAATMQSMAEVFALLRKGGIDQRLAFDILTGSLFDGRVHKTYGGKIVDERYSPPGMTTPLAVKDLGLALAEAETLRAPMPVAGLVHDRLVAAVERGWQDLDWSALGLLAACDAGLSSKAPDASCQTWEKTR